MEEWTKEFLSTRGMDSECLGSLTHPSPRVTLKRFLVPSTRMVDSEYIFKYLKGLKGTAPWELVAAASLDVPLLSRDAPPVNSIGCLPE